ncbi:hypothetical protein BDZ91DRAFT_772821 [Kalaharituber pfeilii]|nr:hypothetical protein BDZ91DRAFT_772821 [Kalaharituber pfeilii]
MPYYNPFARQQEATRANVLTYKILTFLTWLLSIVTTLYYTTHVPWDGHEHPSKHHHRHTTFGQSYAHPTPFTINHVFVGIYWIALFFGQLGYIWHLFVSNDAWVRAACSVGPHFILFNLFNFAHIMLWTRSYFILSEIALIINFLQLVSLYIRHALPTTRESQYVSISTIKSIHIPAVSMPLVWTFFAILWNGAVMVHCTNAIACRILANVVIWTIVPFAGIFLFAYGDWTVGFATAFLTAGLGVGQFFLKVFALQWIFAFTIMALVLLSTIAVMYPGPTTSTTGERAPLLTEDA